MKVGLFIFLWSICLVGSIANGKKFVQVNETVQFEDCEPSDTDESEITSFFFSTLLSGISFTTFQGADKESSEYTFLVFRKVAPDSFFSPPDFLSQS